MTLSTGTTRLRSATMASTWALKSPSTLCLSMRCRHLHLSTHSLSNNLTTSHTFNLLKWDLHQPSLPTESCTMEDCYLPSSRTTRLLIYKPSLPLPLFSAQPLAHRPHSRAARSPPP